MDKNTITGLVLIGILLVGFSFLSRPSEEQIAAQKKYYDSIAVVQQQEEALKAKTEAALANSQKEVASAADSSALFFNALHGTDSKISIQNNVAEITFTTKGGRVYSAMLKDYMAQDKKTPVMLFDGDDASMNFNFYNKAGAIQTKDYFFEAVNKTDSSVTMRLAADSASYIDFIYTLKPDSYLMNFEIKATGMEDKLASTKYVDIDWSQRARQLEKGFTYENRLSELTYKVTGDNVDNLSAAKDDSQDLPGRIDWVAFKNQFFSSVFIAEQDFDKVSVKSKMEQQGSGYIKDYSAEMNTFFDPSGKEPTEMYFYFGPNHFKTLKALDKGRDEKWELHRLVYLGWPLIRWINQFITINVFDWLSGWGLSMGIVLLLLTIMVKIVVQDEEEHDRHQVHHPLHRSHLRLGTRILLLHCVLRIQDVGNSHQQAEQTEVITQEWNMERESDECVISRQVIRPKETLLTKFDSTRYEHEQCHQDRELQQHRQTATHRAYTVLAVQSHHLLLFLHRIFLFGVFLVDLIDFRFQHPHFGCDEVDDVPDADHVPLRLERLSFGIELLLLHFDSDQCSNHDHTAPDN